MSDELTSRVFKTKISIRNYLVRQFVKGGLTNWKNSLFVSFPPLLYRGETNEQDSK